mgnify:FL=1
MDSVDSMVNSEIVTYVDSEILPRYDSFDAAHRRDHVQRVIEQSLELARRHGLDADMAYVIAAYHDTGLVEGREHHHTVSARIVREDVELRRWFSGEQIELMAEAVEDHRASSQHPPRSIYGRVVAEADRFIDCDEVIRRTVQYTLTHHPELDKEQGRERMHEHLREKYGYGGYLKLWFDDSENARRLEELRTLIADREALDRIYDNIYDNLL